MRVLLAPSSDRTGAWSLLELDDDGLVTGEPTVTGDLAGTVRRLEADRPRWVWASTSGIYPLLLRAGIRVARCHDVETTEALLCAHEERPAPASPGGSDSGSLAGSTGTQASLFDTDLDLDADPDGWADDDGAARPINGPPSQANHEGQQHESQQHESQGGHDDRADKPDRLERLLAAHTDQLVRVKKARLVSPGFGLLVAAESAATLAAAEMGLVGLPWRADVHDRVLTGLLGERPRHGGRPPRLQELAITIAEALDGNADRQPTGVRRAGGAPQLNVDSPLEILRAFRRQGVLLETTRAGELKTIDHPAIEPLLRYKELTRLHVAHGWAWRDQWVRSGRFRPEYVVGGVVSGRWATRGGGALQIPRAMRASVIADPGWSLVVADAGQLEPRILAALSGDPGMIAATRDGDLYAALAVQALGRPEARDETKIALLAAMYGARANTPAMAALRRRFPQALDLLEAAARTGEDGGIVRSVLGRTCPPPSPAWQQGSDTVLMTRARARGRFARNFVIQASAADWANALVAGLRQRLTALAETAISSDEHPKRPDLVLFQHDEVVVHSPESMAQNVIEAITESGEEATRLVLGDRGVRIPLTGVQVASYADKH
jgi:DNA polymerase-1